MQNRAIQVQFENLEYEIATESHMIFNAEMLSGAASTAMVFLKIIKSNKTIKFKSKNQTMLNVLTMETSFGVRRNLAKRRALGY